MGGNVQLNHMQQTQKDPLAQIKQLLEGNKFQQQISTIINCPNIDHMMSPGHH